MKENNRQKAKGRWIKDKKINGKGKVCRMNRRVKSLCLPRFIPTDNGPWTNIICRLDNFSKYDDIII